MTVIQPLGRLFVPSLRCPQSTKRGRFLKKRHANGSYKEQGTQQALSTFRLKKKNPRERITGVFYKPWVDSSKGQVLPKCFSGIKAVCRAAWPLKHLCCVYQRLVTPGAELRSEPHYTCSPSLPLAAARNYNPDCSRLCLEHLYVSLNWKYYAV